MILHCNMRGIRCRCSLILILMASATTYWWHYAINTAVDQQLALDKFNQLSDSVEQVVTPFQRESPWTGANLLIVLTEIDERTMVFADDPQGACWPAWRLDKPCCFRYLSEVLRRSVSKESSALLLSNPSKWMEKQWSAYETTIDYDLGKNVVEICLAICISLVLYGAMCDLSRVPTEPTEATEVTKPNCSTENV